MQLNLKTQIKKQIKNNYLVQPHFNKEVSTNIGKEFFTLLNKHFLASKKHHKIFNKNNIKLSFSSMSNLKFIINKRNTLRLNNPDNNGEDKQYNCKSAKNCPLNEKCCRNSIVYKGSQRTSETDKFHYGSCKILFKLQYNNYNQFFKNNKKINSPELSKGGWKLKQSG